MATQQEVIKKFMASLDRTSKSGVAALDEAIQACSNFKSTSEAVSQMVEDCKNAISSDDFLKNYCGINLDNDDTGAITGYDAGGSTYEKDASAIVPENGSLENFTGNSFTVNGVTVRLAEFPKYDDTGEMTINTINFNDLNDATQKYIWQAFKTWWAEGTFKLLEESYGENFGSTSGKELYFGFINQKSSDGGYQTAVTDYKYERVRMAVNLAAYGSLKNGGNPDGESSKVSVYLDRTIAHEMTHAVMSTNINNFYSLPQFVKEGIAELTIGVDDKRKDFLKDLAGNSESLKNALSLTDMGTNYIPSYVAGYMFFRWLAKQTAESAPTEGNDSIDNSVSNVTINALGGNDTINNTGSEVTINGGAGNDTIYSNNNSVLIFGGTDNDTLRNAGGKNVTISAGNGNDFIFNNISTRIPDSGASVSIDGGFGEDYVANSGSNVTISGGTGNDSIVLSSYAKNNFIKYNSGDGNDIITGFNANSTLQIGNGSGTYSTTKSDSGSDIIVSVGSGMITLSGAASLSSIHIDGVLINNNNAYTEGADSINNTVSGKTINALGGNDTVYNGTNGTNVLINGANGNDSIKNLAGKVTILGGANDDTILSYGGYSSKIDGGTGRDYIVNGLNTNNNLFGTGTTLLGGDGDDSIKNVSEKVTISGGKGNDSICSGAQEVSINAGSGNDYIYLYENATKTTVKGGKGNDTIFGNIGNDKLYGDAGNDLLKGGAGNDSLWGGKGNDILWGDAGADKFLYASGDGKDIIFGFDNSDIMKITGKFSASYSKSKREIYFKVGSTSKAITLKDFTATTFNINGKNYKISGSKFK